MKKRIYIAIPVFLIVTLIITSFTPIITMSEDISNKVFRLHIVANSDSERDQELKLLVRDKILLMTDDMYKDCDSVYDAINSTRQNLSAIIKAAQATLSYYGCDNEVRAYVAKEFFDTRYYDNFTLPAGEYDCLKVVIGEGRGHNWWCVMYPTVCLSGCTDDFDDELSGDEKEMLTSNGYVLRFKAVEIYERLKYAITKNKT